MNPRERRISADWDSLREEFSGSDLVTIEPSGDQPYEDYLVTYRLSGLMLDGDQPKVADEHKVRIQLTLDYPREAPYCTPVTPIFHPNIAGHVCIGDFWAAGEQLTDIVAKIADMIQFRLYNVDSPLDTDAAAYTSEHPELFPIGNVDVYQADFDIKLKDGSTGEKPEEKASKAKKKGK